jgi:hypothetical protein
VEGGGDELLSRVVGQWGAVVVLHGRPLIHGSTAVLTY